LCPKEGKNVAEELRGGSRLVLGRSRTKDPLARGNWVAYENGRNRRGIDRAWDGGRILKRHIVGGKKNGIDIWDKKIVWGYSKARSGGAGGR